MEADLGIAPANDRDGCLQDVHWYSGTVGGAFQSYTIGNILSAQFYAAAIKNRPDILLGIARGEFGALHIQYLSAWAKVPAGRTCHASGGCPYDHKTLSCLSSRKIWRDLSLATSGRS
jgi:hypothetical protein